MLKGLELLQLLDTHGPMGVVAIGRKLGVDKATASRMVAAAAGEGWLQRSGRTVELGPRAALLGQHTPANQFIRRAETVTHAVAGVTGLITQVLGLVGGNALALAGAPGNSQSGIPVPSGTATELPLWAGAGPKVIAAFMPAEDLAVLLPPDPLPSPRLAMTAYPAVEDLLPAQRRVDTAGTAVPTRRELLAQLQQIRYDATFCETNELIDGVSCIAVHWPHQPVTAAICCIGATEDIQNRETLIRTVLHTSVQPNINRNHIIRAAALLAEPETPGAAI